MLYHLLRIVCERAEFKACVETGLPSGQLQTYTSVIPGTAIQLLTSKRYNRACLHALL